MGVLSNLLMNTSVDASSAGASSHQHHPTSFDAVSDTGLEFRQYFATACPHCRHLKPAWETASGQYQGPVQWKSIECADEKWNPVEENAELCSNVPGFPTMKMFKDGKEVDEYDGGRTADDLLSYVKKFEETAVAEKSIHPTLAVVASYAMNQVTGFLFGGSKDSMSETSFSSELECNINDEQKQEKSTKAFL